MKQGFLQINQNKLINHLGMQTNWIFSCISTMSSLNSVGWML